MLKKVRALSGLILYLPIYPPKGAVTPSQALTLVLNSCPLWSLVHSQSYYLPEHILHLCSSALLFIHIAIHLTVLKGISSGQAQNARQPKWFLYKTLVLIPLCHLDGFCIFCKFSLCEMSIAHWQLHFDCCHLIIYYLHNFYFLL